MGDLRDEYTQRFISFEKKTEWIQMPQNKDALYAFDTTNPKNRSSSKRRKVPYYLRGPKMNHGILLRHYSISCGLI